MKKIILLVIAIANFYVVMASDIVVTATAATSGNNGELLVEIDPSIIDFPFQLSIVYPGGYTFNTALNTHSYTLTGLAPGQYTVHLTTASECTSTVKVLLLRCRIWGSSYMCFFPSEPSPMKEMFLVGNTDGLLGAEIDASQLVYDLYYHSSEAPSPSLSDSIHEAGIEIVEKVIEQGSTEYDVFYQDEIETDAMFVMKFDQYGNIVWVYHKYSEIDNQEGFNERENSIQNGQDGFERVFPNPASHAAKYKFFCNSADTAKILWTDMLGREIKRELIPVSIGYNTYQIEGLEAIPNGLYFLTVIQDNKIQSMERIVVQH